MLIIDWQGLMLTIQEWRYHTWSLTARTARIHSVFSLSWNAFLHM